MLERLSFPTRVSNASSGALDPTEVIPRPQPLDQTVIDGARVISGEVVTGRHRAPARRSGRGAVGTVALSATGAAIGLSLLMSHQSDTSPGKSQEPAMAAPGKAEGPIDPSLAAAPVSATLQATGEQPRTMASSGARSSSSGTHAKPSGSRDRRDWLEAVERAAAAQRPAHQNQGNGRHRSDGSSGPGGGRGPDGKAHGHGAGGSGQGG